MQVLATYRFARISAFKAREVTRAIQGLPVADALDILKWTPKKAAPMVDKTLRSAIANAENNNNLRVEKLVVQEAVVGEGSTFRRFQPKARGSAGPIRKRTSHIRIVLTDEIEIPQKEEKPKKKAAKPAGASKKKTGAQTPKAPKAEAAPAVEPAAAAAEEKSKE